MLRYLSESTRHWPNRADLCDPGAIASTARSQCGIAKRGLTGNLESDLNLN
jgi:hypothetical protein